MPFPTLHPLADRASLFAALRQDALRVATDALGEHRWDVNIPESSLVFTATADPSRRIETRAHLIASIAPGPRSVLWGWAHSSGDPSGVAAQLKAYGEQHEIPQLAMPEVPFPVDADVDAAWIAEAAHTIGRVAVDVTGLSFYYSAPINGGSRAVFALDAPIPPLTVVDAAIAMSRMLAGTIMSDARGAVWNLARLAGWTLHWLDEAFTGATVSDATGSATFRFDQYARIVGFETQLGRL